MDRKMGWALALAMALTASACMESDPVSPGPRARDTVYVVSRDTVFRRDTTVLSRKDTIALSHVDTLRLEYDTVFTGTRDTVVLDARDPRLVTYDGDLTGFEFRVRSITTLTCYAFDAVLRNGATERHTSCVEGPFWTSEGYAPGSVIPIDTVQNVKYEASRALPIRGGTRYLTLTGEVNGPEGWDLDFVWRAPAIEGTQLILGVQTEKPLHPRDAAAWIEDLKKRVRVRFAAIGTDP